MASSAEAIASVAPHVTVTSVSGSTLRPYHSAYFATRASRSRFAPQVMAYWFTSSRIARAAAYFSTSGAGKLGNPWARLIAPCSFASRVMPRITDSVKPWVRVAVCIVHNINPGAVARLDLAEAVPRGSVRHPSREQGGRMRSVTTLARALCIGALVAEALGCGDGTSTGPAPTTGTIWGTVSVAKGMFAPPAVQRVPMSATPVGPALDAFSLPAKRRSAGARHPRGRVPGSVVPQFTRDELIVTFRAAALDAPPVGSRALAAPAVSRSVASAIRSRLAPDVAVGRTQITGVSPALLAARVRVSDIGTLEEVAARLRADGSIAAVERNGIGRSDVAGTRAAVTTAATDPYAVYQAWHYGIIDLPRAWALTTGSAAVLVAVVDDGIRDHPDITANLRSDGYDFVSGGATYAFCDAPGTTTDNTGDGDGYDPDPTDPISYDYDFGRDCIIGPSVAGNHGLHVAGTIGAAGNNGTGGTGVNWAVQIRPVRVVDVAGVSNHYDVAPGILYAAGLPAGNGA